MHYRRKYTMYERLGNPGCDKWMHNNGNRRVNTMDVLPKEVAARLTTSHYDGRESVWGRG